MIELTEALLLSKQLNEHLINKKVMSVIVNQSPNRLVWFTGDEKNYINFKNNLIKGAKSYGGILEICLSEYSLFIGDGINLRYGEKDQNKPKKHQLLLVFEDESFLSFSARMYGGIMSDINGPVENEYIEIAKEKPSPLSDAFSYKYFQNMIKENHVQKLSLKAFLATKQRIPGLGNGLLQDVLFNAGLHPKRKVRELELEEVERLFNSIKTTLKVITDSGMRNTEKDIFGQKGAYEVLMSKDTYKLPCPKCGGKIIKKAYMGGSIYYCELCQPE